MLRNLPFSSRSFWRKIIGMLVLARRLSSDRIWRRAASRVRALILYHLQPTSRCCSNYFKQGAAQATRQGSCRFWVLNRKGREKTLLVQLMEPVGMATVWNLLQKDQHSRTSWPCYLVGRIPTPSPKQHVRMYNMAGKPLLGQPWAASARKPQGTQARAFGTRRVCVRWNAVLVEESRKNQASRWRGSGNLALLPIHVRSSARPPWKPADGFQVNKDARWLQHILSSVSFS